eukprot:1140197-Amphidinium_carterae.1
MSFGVFLSAKAFSFNFYMSFDGKTRKLMEVVKEGLTKRNYLEREVQKNIPASLQPYLFLHENGKFALDTFLTFRKSAPRHRPKPIKERKNSS